MNRFRSKFFAAGALAVAFAFLVSFSGDADARKGGNGKGRGKNTTAVEVVTTTTEETTTTTVPFCGAYCQPSEPTLVEGTTCDYVWAECIVDEYDFPNCQWWTASCD